MDLLSNHFISWQIQAKVLATLAGPARPAGITTRNRMCYYHCSNITLSNHKLKLVRGSCFMTSYQNCSFFNLSIYRHKPSYFDHTTTLLENWNHLKSPHKKQQTIKHTKHALIIAAKSRDNMCAQPTNWKSHGSWS